MARRLVLLALVLLALAIEPAAAAPQSTLPQRCLNDVDSRGWLVLKMQGKVADACLRDFAAGRLERLGAPPEPQTAQPCPANDRQGNVAIR